MVKPRPARTPERRNTRLYGTGEGDWLLITAPAGISPHPAIDAAVYGTDIPPPVVRMRSFGNPRDLITSVCELVPGVLPGAWITATAPVQQTVANILGVTQQSVSRYITAGIDPDLPDKGWRNLAALAWACTEFPDKPADTTRIQEILASYIPIRAR